MRRGVEFHRGRKRLVYGKINGAFRDICVITCSIARPAQRIYQAECFVERCTLVPERRNDSTNARKFCSYFWSRIYCFNDMKCSFNVFQMMGLPTLRLNDVSFIALGAIEIYASRLFKVTHCQTDKAAMINARIFKIRFRWFQYMTFSAMKTFSMKRIVINFWKCSVLYLPICYSTYDCNILEFFYVYFY